MTHPDAKEILNAARANLTPERISRMLRTPLADVLQVLRANGIDVVERPERRFNHAPQKVPETRIPATKTSPVRMALQVFNGRAKERENDFTLDGMPIGSFELIRRANRVLKAHDMPQIEGCDEWRIDD